MTAANERDVRSRKAQQSRIDWRSQPDVACSVVAVMLRRGSCQIEYCSSDRSSS
jgi:hypothetical protein